MATHTVQALSQTGSVLAPIVLGIGAPRGKQTTRWAIMHTRNHARNRRQTALAVTALIVLLRLDRHTSPKRAWPFHTLRPYCG